MTAQEFLDEWNDGSDKLLVHTSGSTGKPKELWVEKRRMAASARNTCGFLGLREGDTALLCMSPDYIAGKMMIVRSVVCGLRLTAVAPSGHPLAMTGEDGFDLVAMVPMQVFNSLRVLGERERLMRIRNLIIGGGAIDEMLERELQSFPNAVWSTYGMTETLSHIALRRVNGREACRWYMPFDNVSVSLDKEGCLVIDAPDVCAGRLTTNDIAEIADDGRRFRILGRKDNVICSGGIKMCIEDIERTLAPHMPVPFMVTRCDDHKFGQAVTLLSQNGNEREMREICTAVLPRYMRPRYYVAVDKLPMTDNGKPARAEAERIAASFSHVSPPTA